MKHLDQTAFHFKGDTPASRGDVADFRDCCADHAWFYSQGWISLQIAVDNLQGLAERWDLISVCGQDAVQAMLAETFSRC